MDKKNTNQGVKSCKSHCTLQGLCKYWNRGTCNNSTCKYLHACVASIQPLKITRHSEITLIISKQVTLSPPEAATFINENYKNSQIGLTILLDNKQTAANLKKIVRGNAQDKMMRKEEVEKLLLQQKGKKQQGMKNKNKIQITKLEQNTTTESRSETKIDQSNQSIFHSKEKTPQSVPKLKGILKNSNNILTDSSNSLDRSTNKRPISPIQQVGNPSLPSFSMDSNKSGSSSQQLYYDDSPKNENLKIPPKKKSTLHSDQQSLMATKNQMTSQLEKIEKQEEDHQKQIIALSNHVEKLLQDQNQMKKEFDLLLSMNSSKKDYANHMQSDGKDRISEFNSIYIYINSSLVVTLSASTYLFSQLHRFQQGSNQGCKRAILLTYQYLNFVLIIKLSYKHVWGHYPQ
ncbi:hypothetical protein ABPG72_020061 [Tetrahymena utriculariae]